VGLKTITIQGRLTRDPAKRQTKNDTKMCSFSVAVDSNRPGKDNPSTFFNVAVFGKQAETCVEYLHKGDEVSLVGDVELDVYQNEGKTYANIQITANNVFFGRKASDGQGQKTEQREEAPVW
jgi:single-strand DNA-binding protein